MAATGNEWIDSEALSAPEPRAMDLLRSARAALDRLASRAEDQNAYPPRCTADAFADALTDARDVADAIRDVLEKLTPAPA